MVGEIGRWECGWIRPPCSVHFVPASALLLQSLTQVAVAARDWGEVMLLQLLLLYSPHTQGLHLTEVSHI